MISAVWPMPQTQQKAISQNPDSNKLAKKKKVVVKKVLSQPNNIPDEYINKKISEFTETLKKNQKYADKEIYQSLQYVINKLSSLHITSQGNLSFDLDDKPLQSIYNPQGKIPFPKYTQLSLFEQDVHPEF